jgi:Beta-propeller repeat/Abnormal spindle-like microcephaly-assoc'd, ASPM-SPD-2-Hydin
MKPDCLVCLLAAASLFAQSKPGAPALLEPALPTSQPDPQLHSRLREGYGKLPLSFEPNQGQSDPRVKFLARGAGYTLFLTKEGAVLSFVEGGGQGSKRQAVKKSNLRMQLLGARQDAMISGFDNLPGKTNYFRGNDPKKWTTNILSFAKVRYSGVLDGVDLIYYGNQGRLEYDLVVAPETSAGAIRLAFSGARGMHIDRRSGDLVLELRNGANDGTNNNEVRFRKPVAYQEENVDASQSATGNAKGRHLIAADYVVDSRNHVGFRLGPYDRRKTLLIDPTLSYSTYLGGGSNDYGTSIAVDSSGSAYVTGYTNSTDFPITAGSLQTTCGGGCSGTTVDAFVTKFDPTGSFLVYSTYLGGSGNDQGNGIALDPAGDAYIVGQTLSSDFPTTPGAFQITCSNSCKNGAAFITELNSSGSALVYSTYLGGTSINQGNAIVLDASLNAYVTGFTQSTNFPTTPGAYQTTCTCSKLSDVFVTELNPTGSGLVYSTYLGGSGQDVGYAIVLDSSDNAYLTGYTHSTNFPTTPGAFQTTSGANTAAFVTVLNSTGSALVYSTYLGGSTSFTTPCEACGTSIAVDALGDAYVGGLTAESNFPTTPGAFQTVLKSSPQGHDGFITKLDPTGATLLYSTYVGGSKDDGATAIALDSAGNVWFKGNSQSPDFPVTPGAYQTIWAGDFDAYIAELNPTGSSLLYSSYLGGSGAEFGGATRALALDTQSPPNVYLTGYTDSTNFPTIAGSLQSSLGGSNDAFVSKFSPSPNVGLSPASVSFGSQTDGTTSSPQIVTLTNTGNVVLNVTNVNITGTNAADFAQTNTCGQVAPSATCTASVTFTPTLVGTETGNVSITDDAANSPQLEPLSGVGVTSQPMVVLSPASLVFSLQLIGTSSPAQVVTLSNVGGGDLHITSISPSGDFSQVNTCGSIVAAGTNCTITVTFTPTSINTRTGSITVTDDASTSPQTVSLTGTGTYISLSPTSLNFGTVTVGQSSSPQTITLTNTDTVALNIKTVSIVGLNKTDFTLTNTCSRVAKGASCSITVTFTPTKTGNRTAKVSITDVGGGSPQTAALTGTGQ